MAHILLVDDNPDNRDALVRGLQKRGFTVTEAAGGQSAIELAGSDNPDLILMDMNMPEVDGWEATGAIRDQGLAVPIIAITAHALAGDRERALQAGCSDYHPKPIDMEALVATIQDLLSRSE